MTLMSKYICATNDLYTVPVISIVIYSDVIVYSATVNTFWIITYTSVTHITTQSKLNRHNPIEAEQQEFPPVQVALPVSPIMQLSVAAQHSACPSSAACSVSLHSTQ